MPPRNLREYKQAIDRLIERIPGELASEAVQSAGNGLVLRMKDRIFNQGLDKNNKIIAEGYSRTPVYVSKEQFIKKGSFKARGKNSRSSRFENGSMRKSMYLKGGYEELKKVQGLVYQRVNWLYSGKLKRAFVARMTNGVLYIGFNQHREADKAGWLEKRYRKKVFQASREEILEYHAAVIRHLRRVTRETFA